MNLLLDTHTLLWFVDGNPRISPKATQLIEHSENQSFVSVASLWEIGIKVGLGRLRFDVPLEEFVATKVEGKGFEILPIRTGHIVHVASLPSNHRDPFDRMLVAQCSVEKLSIVSADTVFDEYAVSRLW